MNSASKRRTRTRANTHSQRIDDRSDAPLLIIVPTLCVGMHFSTLCVAKVTQSVLNGMPTRSIGTIIKASVQTMYFR
ncbi:hypothetical protein AN901_200881 [Pseudomonas syringae pv. theae]|nr:hypothetical protein AN901_200881 [Pseudomonas syringae pv. theae]